MCIRDRIITDNSGLTHQGILTMEHPSIGNITLPNLFINHIRFARTFEDVDYFFAHLYYKDQKFDEQLFV